VRDVRSDKAWSKAGGNVEYYEEKFGW
jgi:hypothetical protein